MNFVNMLGMAGWVILLAIPPLIVLLYFLKLRRQPVEVPSTYLWLKAIEDLHVNSIWQRLRRSLLLFLQLLAVLLIVLACLRPGWKGEKTPEARQIFLVDTSASMMAKHNNKTRLAEAKDRVRQLIDQMERGDVAMLISFSDEAKIEQSFTDNKNLLREKLDRVRQTKRGTDLDEALRAAGGLANPGRSGDSTTVSSESVIQDVAVADAMPAKLQVFSDGGISRVPEFALGNLETQYYAIGSEEPENVGIVAFETGENPEILGQIQGFAQIQNCGKEDQTIDVTLYLDDQIWDAKEGVVVPANSGSRMTFDILDASSSLVNSGVLKLVVEMEDDLEEDNVAYAVINSPRKSKVALVTPGNGFLELVLSTPQVELGADVIFLSPAALSTKSYQDPAGTGAFDLVIFDRCTPEEMPQANTIFMGTLPPIEGWEAGESKSVISILDTLETHPLFHFVQLGNVLIAEAKPLTAPEGSVELVDGDGPIVSIAPRGGFEDLVFGFSLYSQGDDGNVYPNTDWPKQLSFPTFFRNTLHYFGGAARINSSKNVIPGKSATLRTLSNVAEIEVTPPGKEKFSVNRSAGNTFVVHDTGATGIYSVREGDSNEVSQRFAVNLLDENESNLNVREILEIGYHEIKGERDWIPARIELWKWVLVVCLVVLFVEWYIYNKRVYI